MRVSKCVINKTSSVSVVEELTNLNFENNFTVTFKINP